MEKEVVVDSRLIKKEYKVMVKSIKTGEWHRATHTMCFKVFKDKAEADEFGKSYMKRESEKACPLFSEYKIMSREVSEWKEI